MTAGLTNALLERFARQARGTPDVQDGKVVLQYPKAMRWFLWSGAAFFALVILGAWFDGVMSGRGFRVAWLASGVLGTLVVATSAEASVRLLLDAHGIGGRTAFRGRRAIAWRDVESVGYSLGNRWFVLMDRHGERLRVSTLLQGHQALIAALETHVPEAVWRGAVASWRRQAA